MALLSLQQIHKTFEKGTVNVEIQTTKDVIFIDRAFFKGFMNLL